MSFLNKLSNFFARVEARIAILLVALIVFLIIVNVVTRFSGNAVYWVDELVIYLMVWMVFISMPLLVHLKKNITVNVITDFLHGWPSMVCMAISDVVVLCVSAFLFYVSVNWFGPVDLIESGFDFERFSENTFNYIYQEPTNTLVMNKYIFWLVMPVSALLCSIHALSNLVRLFEKVQITNDLPVESET